MYSGILKSGDNFTNMNVKSREAISTSRRVRMDDLNYPLAEDTLEMSAIINQFKDN